MSLGELVFRPNADGTGRWYLNPPFATEGAAPGSKWILCPTATRKDQKEAARAWRKQYVETMVRLGAQSLASAPQTVDNYLPIWIADREQQGLGGASKMRSDFKNWISPIIGTKPIATIAKPDIEAVATSLDLAVREGKIVGKTARNIFGHLTKMMTDACTARSGTVLRVREDNPAKDVARPAKGTDREGPYLYPAEFLAVLNCKRVPLRWKRLITFAVYLMPRCGEQAALDWTSVNEGMGYVDIHRAIERDTGEVKPTKNERNRKVRIPPQLLPMLAQMRKEFETEVAAETRPRLADDSGNIGRVFASMPPAEEMAKRLRKYLGWAGCTRSALFADDATRRHMTWHDLRHTGACWRLMRGDTAKQVQRAGGWKKADMLDTYANEVETFESVETFGTPFPEVGPAVGPNETSEDMNPTEVLPSAVKTDGSCVDQQFSNPLGDAHKPPERTGFFGETVGSVGSTVGSPGGSSPTGPTVDPTALSAALVAAAAAGDLDLVRRIVTLLEGSKS